MSQSTVNLPRFRVTLNGQILSGVKSVTVSQSYGYRIGQFDFVKTFMPEDAFPVSWWAATASKTMLANIELSADGTNFQTIITGNVDNHQYDPIAGSICVAGRDMAAALCDERIVGTYRNQTASQIAALFASEHGLKTSITATTTLAGRYYDTDHDEIHCGDFSAAINEWDLLCRLGSEEGITPFVSGQTLYFNPPPSNPRVFPVEFSTNAAGQIVSNVTELKLERNMTGARDVVVTVRSWNSRKKATFSSTVRTKTRTESADANVAETNYLLVLPNLTQAQCLAKAQQRALDYAQHERNLVATFPSFGIITPQTLIQLSGTNTDYDMIYYPQGVTYSVDFEGGGRTEIFAKNSSALDLYDDGTDAPIGKSPDR